MSEGIVADKILEAFGGEFFTGEQEPGGQWSPNMYKNMYIMDDAVVSETHFGKWEAVPMVGNDILSPEDAEEVFNYRKLGALEGVYASPGMGGIGVSRIVSQFFRFGEDRLHVVGEVAGLGPEGPEITKEEDLPGSEGWEGRYGLQPEHYDMDAEGGKLWSILQRSVEDTESEDEAEPDKQEDTGDTFAEVSEYYSDTTNGTINKIIREYSKIFASGFEVITPAGILLENDKGYGVLGHIEGVTLKKEKVNRNLQMLYSYLKEAMGITEVPVRSIKEIANVIASGVPTAGGKRYSGNLIFPYKMMEYAFGRKRIAKSDSDSIEIYQEHSKRADWDSYARDEVAESLRDVMLYVVWVSLKQKGLDGEPETPEANKVATDILDRFQTAFCTAILVSTYDTAQGNLVAVKVRVLDPTGNLPRDRNILEEVISRSHGDIDDSDKKMVYPVKHNGAYVEYHLELDTKLANAEPLFAYKALEKTLEQGKSITYDTIIFGKDSNDKILRNGGDVDLTKKLSHAVIAGSRAGKGVWTFSILGGACSVKKPIFYLDDKPDMASLFKSLAPNGFVVNGENITVDPENGTDYFSEFASADSWVNPKNVPDYVQSLMGGVSYRNLGSFVYVKALTLAMGVLAARVEVPSRLDDLGGAHGIVVVVDELANANSNLMAKFGTFNQHIANTGYFNKLKSQIEEGEERRIDADKPKPEDYWFTHFYQGMQKSLNKMQSLSNAGLKNVEAARSDVFILTQEPPEMITSAGQVSELFRKPNKNSNSIAGGIDDPRILPSFALLGGTDAFVGYDRDNRAFLDQGNIRSASYPYLNSVNRNFGYLAQYGPEVRDRFNTSALADKAIYYKPMLLFADGETDSYFVRNAMNYAAEAGIDDPQSIITRNEDPENPGKIHPAVGFEGYLHMAGMDRSSITESLSKSGDIAQVVTDALGYDGSWMDLLLDFRPEWQFTVDDIVDAMKGKKLADGLESRMEDFMTVYPEAFESVGSDVEEDLMGGFEDFDQDPDQGIDDYESEQEEVLGFIPQESSDEDKDGYDTHHKKLLDEGFRVYDGPVGEENGDFDTEEIPVGGYETAEEAYMNPETYVPDIGPGLDLSEADTVELEDNSEPSLVVDWSDPNSIREAQAYLKSRLNSGELDTSIADNQYGNGRYTTPDGQADNYKPHGGALRIMPTMAMDMREPRTIADLIESVTQGAYRVIGGAPQLKSVRVIDGSLILNNTMYRPEISEEYFEGLPYDLETEIRSGNIARLFRWETLLQGSQIRRLAFDSPDFVSDYVSGDMGWKGRVPVPGFFEKFRQLQHLTIGKSVFTRGDFRAKLQEDSTYYQPTAVRAIADTIDRKFSRGTSSSWNYTKTTLGRKDIGLSGKFFGTAAGLTGTAVAGTAAVTTKVTKGLFTGVRQGILSMREAFKDAEKFK